MLMESTESPTMKNRPNVELMKAELTEPIADVLKEKVSIRNLDFFYGDYRALKSISLPLYDRKVTAFIGPSGCGQRSEEHTSELQSLMRISYAVFFLKNNTKNS